MNYRGFKIEVKGDMKFVRLNKGRILSDKNLIKLKLMIDDLVDFNSIDQEVPKKTSNFWKNQSSN